MVDDASTEELKHQQAVKELEQVRAALEADARTNNTAPLERMA
jgi:hypothetical protein